jgi:hypothetical protein
LKVYLEVGAKKAFASAADWPGLSRGGKTEDEALDNLLAYGERYAAAIGVPASKLGPRSRARIEVVERLTGNATTDFGAPGVVPDLDREPISGERLEEMIELLRTSWRTFEKAAAKAEGKTLGPAGPRGGGRILDGIARHVAEADAAYLSAVGGRLTAGSRWSATQEAFVAALHARARGELPDVGPRGGKRWPAPYAIRRAAWHALDHAWEIEDRLAG